MYKRLRFKGISYGVICFILCIVLAICLLPETIMRAEEVVDKSAFTAIERRNWISGYSNIKFCVSKGEVHPLIVLVDFSDTKFDEGFNREYVYRLFFGEAEECNSDNFPKESLSAWYKRSSYGKLYFSGEEEDILEIHLGKTRDEYTDIQETEINEYDELMQEVMGGIDEYAKKNDRYDIDDNGAYDALCIIYAGETGVWSSQWYDKCTYWDDFSYVQCIEKSLTDATTIIHEFGHLLGLPDLYDYHLGGLPNSLVKDVTLLRRYLAKGWNVKVAVEDADIDGDGDITPKDVTMLRRYLAGGWGVVLTKKSAS